MVCNSKFAGAVCPNAVELLYLYTSAPGHNKTLTGHNWRYHGQVRAYMMYQLMDARACIEKQDHAPRPQCLGRGKPDCTHELEHWASPFSMQKQQKRSED